MSKPKLQITIRLEGGVVSEVNIEGLDQAGVEVECLVADADCEGSEHEVGRDANNIPIDVTSPDVTYEPGRFADADRALDTRLAIADRRQARRAASLEPPGL